MPRQDLITHIFAKSNYCYFRNHLLAIPNPIIPHVPQKSHGHRRYISTRRFFDISQNSFASRLRCIDSQRFVKSSESWIAVLSFSRIFMLLNFISFIQNVIIKHFNNFFFNTIKIKTRIFLHRCNQKINLHYWLWLILILCLTRFFIIKKMYLIEWQEDLLE